MKNIKKILLTTLLSIVLVFSNCNISLAAKSLKQNTNITVSYRKPIKLIIKKAGVYEFKIKSGYALNIEQKDGDINEYIGYDGRNKYVVLEKGTYFLEPMMFEDVTFAYRGVKNPNKPNYCTSKAITLKKKKTIMVSQTLNEHYSRWYKVRLTKNGYIKLKVFEGDSNIKILNGRMANIETTIDDNGNMRTKDKLVKGTYYIKVCDNWLYDNISFLVRFYLK